VISFRYLVVTVVAIFLALGLGVLAGTTVIDKGIVDTLKSNRTALRKQVDDLNKQLGHLNDFFGLAVPFMVDGRLAHKDVVLITDDNADGSAVSNARDFLQQANATVVAELHVRSTLSPTNPSAQTLQQLLTADGVPTAGRGNFTADAARGLADRLLHGPPAPGPSATSPHKPRDLLADLLSSGYLDFPHNTPPNPQDVGGPGQIVVTVAGGTADPAVPLDAFMVPFVKQLLRNGMPVAAAEPMDAVRPFVGLLRDDPSIPDGSRLVTVDDLSADQSFGGVALVLGLKELLRFGQGGDYGVKGAPNIIPQLP